MPHFPHPHLPTQGARVNQLSTHYFRPTALHNACAYGQADVVRLLLDRGGDPCIPDTFGSTPLIVAATNGWTRVVRCLLGHGGSPIQRPDSDRRTPVWWAARNGRTEVVRMLLKAGADPTLPDHDGLTPLAQARRGGHHRCVTLLEVGGVVEGDQGEGVGGGRVYECRRQV